MTDLFFLGKNILGKDLHEKPHREVCDFFLKKNPDIPLKDLDPVKQRLLMIPRGTFKSTLAVIDCVQLILNYPDIRILILTAEKKLATAFSEELRNYFTVIKDQPTDFQLLFPEFCVSASKREPSNEFTTPARKTFRKEPTVWSNSIGSNLPGWHCDYLRCDDVVTNLNSIEGDQVEKIISGFNFARKLIDPDCYCDLIGTPYDSNDLYAHVQKNSDSSTLKVLVRPAWTVKPESKGKSESELGKQDYDLLFPARLTYEFLAKERKLDPITFNSQYLVDPRAHSRHLFTEELVRASVISWQSIPKQVSYYAAWDLAYGQSMVTDFTAGPVAAVDPQGRIYIVDLSHGRFNGTDLVFRIADTIRRYPLQLSAIEDMHGARWLEPEIARACARLGVQPRIHWLPVDRSKDAKVIRISRLAQLFAERRLFISDACPELETIIEAFASYTGSKNAHDDIPDAISFFPRFVQINPVNAEQNARDWEQLRKRALYDMLYPVAPPAPAEPEIMPEPVSYFS